MHKESHHQHGPATDGLVLHWASRYDMTTNLLFLGRERAFRDKSAALAGIKLGDRVLDVGCGTGSFTLAAARAAGSGGEIHGIDAAPEMVDFATRRAAKEGAAIEFHNVPIENLSFTDAYFDVVISSLMLHHLPDDLKTRGLSEVRRVLKPGGVFLGVDFDLTERPLLGPVIRFIHGGTPLSPVAKTKAILEELGFDPVETGPTSHGFLRFAKGRKPAKA